MKHNRLDIFQSLYNDIILISVSDPDLGFFADPDPDFKNPDPSVFALNIFNNLMGSNDVL